MSAEIKMPTIEENADELADAFEFLEDRYDQLNYLMDLGNKLPPMPEADKTEENKVHGCQSQVWVAAHPRHGSEKVIDLAADSDAAITKGVVYILWKVHSGQPAQQIVDFDVERFLERIQLNQLLSMNRRNGLEGMVKRIKNLAAQAVNEA